MSAPDWPFRAYTLGEWVITRLPAPGERWTLRADPLGFADVDEIDADARGPSVTFRRWSPVRGCWSPRTTHALGTFLALYDPPVSLADAIPPEVER